MKKTTVDHEDVSGKSKKLRKATQLGNVIFVTIYALFYVALVMASVLFCNLVCITCFYFIIVIRDNDPFYFHIMDYLCIKIRIYPDICIQNSYGDGD